MITLSTEPNEKGTAVFTVTFTDEDGATVVPTEAAWQLSKTNGDIVNSRSFDNCTFTGSTVVLTGDDLQLFSSDNRYRIFAVQATYDGTVDDMQITDEVRFKINNLISQE